MKRFICFCLFVVAGPMMRVPLSQATLLDIPATMTQGIQACQNDRWLEAIGDFLDVLSVDPRNKEAHAYLALSLEQDRRLRAANAREEGLFYLNESARLMAARGQDNSDVMKTLAQAHDLDAREHGNRWDAYCGMAEIEEHAGHLLAACDLVCHVLAEDPNHLQARRILTDLQAAIHARLTPSGLARAPMVPAVQWALEGFYAYAGADFPKALAFWKKAADAVGVCTANSPSGLADLHFQPYQKMAQAHVDEENRIQESNAVYLSAMTAYGQGHYAEALDRFQKVAVLNPEHPNLGEYLVNAAHQVEVARTPNLDDAKREQAANYFSAGLAEFEHREYNKAIESFKQVLALEPSHPQASAYLAEAQGQMEHHNDPQAAEVHYQNALIRYASSRLDDAIRECHIALELDPDMEKASILLTKSQKEQQAQQTILSSGV